jgi:hypothetical protein
MASLVSQDGGTMVRGNTAGIVTQEGGAVVATGGGNYTQQSTGGQTKITLPGGRVLILNK